MTYSSAHRGSAFLSLALTATLAACGGGGSATAEDWTGTITDSAGVSVVLNPEEGMWGGAPRWRLVEEFRVGGIDAPTEAQIAVVAPMGLDLDSDGRVYVADTQAQMVLVYGSDGAFLHTIGTPGRGPGEIGPGMTALFVVDQEVWIADLDNVRINKYALDGTFHESVPLDLTLGLPFRWDKLDGDRVVVQLRKLEPSSSAARDALVFVGPGEPDTLAVLPAGLSFQLRGGAAQLNIFEAEPVWDAATDGRLFSAINTDYRVELRTREGVLTTVVRREVERRPVTDSDQQRIRVALRQLMVDRGAPPQAVEAILGQMTFAEFYPAFAQLLAGPSGSLWVQRIATAEELGASDDFDLQNLGSDDWDVFDSDGRYLGAMAMPNRFTPMRVEGEAFWGVQRDEFDVQSVVRYRLVDVESR